MKPLVLIVIVLGIFGVVLTINDLAVYTSRAAPPVECAISIGPVYLSDIMEHMTEAEASALMRAIRETRG